MTANGKQFEITHGDHWAVVTEVGANLRGYRYADRDVTHVYSPDAIAPKSCGAVLIPWPNRIAGGKYTFAGKAQQLALSDPALGNASHGLGCWVRWTPVEVTSGAVTLGCDIVPQKGWPFEVRAEITYWLGASGLTVEMKAENTGDQAMPFGAGCHPYVSIGDTPLEEVQLVVDAGQRLVVDDRQIPTETVVVAGTEYDLRAAKPLGALRLDTAYTELAATDGRGVAVVRAGADETRVWWDASTFTHVQLFTPPALESAPAVAIEPMTCPANAFNSGIDLLVLEPGQTWTGSWGIESAAP